MRSDVRRISRILLFIALSLIVGCDSIQPLELAETITRESLVIVTGAGNLIFELFSNEHLRIRDLTASYDNEDLIINGKIKRSVRNCCDRVTGHIDIAVFDPDAYLIDAFSTPFSPAFIPKRGTKSSSFQARIGQEVPKGSSVKIAYHSTTAFMNSASNKVKMDCGENTALLGKKAGSIKTIEIE